MTYNSLRDFIDKLEKEGRLVRVKEPVSTYLEMTEIGTRLIAEGGPAVLFENVTQEAGVRCQVSGNKFVIPANAGISAVDSEKEIPASAGMTNLQNSPLEGESQSRGYLSEGDSERGHPSPQPSPSRGEGVNSQTSTLDSSPSSTINHQPSTSSIPVLINLFGTVERIAWGMNRTPEQLREVGETLAFLKQPEPPGGLKEAWEMLPLLKKVMAMKPKTVSKAPCQEVVLTGDDIDLGMLPIQTCWPGDASPLITWPLVVTKGPSANVKDKGEVSRPREPSASEAASHLKRQEAFQGDNKQDNYNLGIYRMQVTGKNKTLMRWLKQRGGAQHHARWKKEKREPLPAAAVIGADPGTILAAVTPVPDTLSEYQFAGLLRGSKVELVDCKTVPLKVPAQAEIILEGYVSLDEYGDEGPFGDHTGYYNSVEPFPVFTITAITMRKNPIYLSTYTGKPPDEPSILGEALNEVFIPLLQQQFPEIIDFWLPPEGCSYRVAVVSIKKAYPGHAKRIMMGVWSFLRQFVYTKFVIVVDDDINTRDWKEVIWAMSTRMDPVRDVTLIENTPIDYLDFASPESGLGGKMGLDATNKWPPETKREWGEEIGMKQEVVDKITERWSALGLPGKGKPIW